MKLHKFSVNEELEVRYAISKSDFKAALDAGYIKIQDKYTIAQKWFAKTNKYKGRIRKTTYDFGGQQISNYTHTIKHRVNKKMYYEVDSAITVDEYTAISRLYPGITVETKTRFILTDTTGDYTNYIVSADIYTNSKNVIIEYENKDPLNQDKFLIPSWLKNENRL